MGILSRYVLRRYLAAFAAVLAVLSLMVIVVEMLLNLDDVIAAQGGFVSALTYTALRVPFEYLPYLVPISAFIAAFVTVGIAARSLETVAMKAGGVSPLRVITPVLVAALGISALQLVTNETLAVRASHAWRRHERGDAGEVAFRHGSFWYHRGRYVYNIRDADPTKRTLVDVTIFELDNEGLPLQTIQATHAQIAPDGSLVLRNARIRRFEPGHPTEASSFHRVPEARIALPAKPNLALLDADVSSLSIGDLFEYLETHAGGESGTIHALAVLNERLANPLTAFLFTLLALPLGLRVERTKSLARPALYGAVLVFVFYTVRRYGSTLATQDVTSPTVTPWAVLLFFTVFGLFQLARSPR